MLNKPLLYAAVDIDLLDQNNKYLELNENVVISQSVIRTGSEVHFDSKVMEAGSENHREHLSAQVGNHSEVAFYHKNQGRNGLSLSQGNLV